MRQYLANIYLGVYTALVGMRITFKQLLQPSVTHQYPYEHSFEKKKNVRDIPKGYRGKLDNRIEDCIGCRKCEIICPVDCITMTTRKLPKGERLWDSMSVVHLKDRTEIVGNIEGDEKLVPDTTITIKTRDERTVSLSSEEVDRIVERKPVIFYLDQFDIDMSLCMYCGLCTEVCPTECLTMIDNLKDGIAYSTFDRTDLIYLFAAPEMYDQQTEASDEAEAAD
ncbi:MAG: 4Fe-4S binding protein [Candidatus Poribacteria bacterium]|nr:4Fe-4S binding protein [Candidatus Poribacteria bacterium]